ncbi:histidine kinase [Flavobacterium branchiophilum]|uniref:2TM domain-containing protein n=1 Tax=Flavobacterium branchiophilum TaxID=55197 RepID=A0A543G8D9_9FLAO|nr:histidine kinase [Flavobacterium branchiophilum]OXA74596.1 histidine kinase [Flavobacterium branchiophilum] [Flavobacterium branchiophilum NBRC 15030 = ATCC 35035]TQM42342.1 2TM domain-containing protein [Flavobacterium branchiophilum]GEM55528.1 histidine kinase [Flavobacterium branchiophilum NBRC 15030 = ATCC 35035]
MKNNYDYYLKIILKGFLVSIFIAVAIIAFEILFGRKIIFNKEFYTEIGYYILFGSVLNFVNTLYFDYLNHQLVWDRFKRFRMLIGAFGSMMLSMFVIFLLRLLVAVLVYNQDISRFLLHESASVYGVYLMIVLVVSLFFHAVYFYKKSKDTEVQTHKIMAVTASAKFESLKNQIDPHFLFNSLNVLSALIEENPTMAQKFTTSLSKVYRYVLEQKDKELVTVLEELDFAKTYMSLLQMRFEDSLTFEIFNFEGFSDEKIVPLALQLLLENTVKHNIVSEQKPLHIQIYVSEGYLCIKNNLQIKNNLENRKGVGLQNIQERYGLICMQNIQILKTNDSFEVKLPLLNQLILKNEVMEKATQNAYWKAKTRVKELKEFYVNLLSYCCVIPVLVIINLVVMPHFHWFWFSALGWGFGLIMHALRVFGFSSAWEERKMKEILNR